jgi:DNA polymerase-1
MTSLTAARLQPYAEGTFNLATLEAWYTLGRDYAPTMALALAARPGPVAVDIETEGLGRAAMHIKAVTFATADHAAILDPRDPLQAEAIRSAFAEARTLVVHNSPFDVPVLVRSGLMAMSDIRKVHDTLVYGRLAEPDTLVRKDLLSMANRYLGTDGSDVLKQAFKSLGMSASDGFKAFDLDRPIYVHGAAIDGLVTARIFPLVRAAALARLTSGHPYASLGVSGDEAARLVEREQVINRMMLRRSAKGLRVDLEHLDNYRDEVGAEQTKARGELAAEGIREGNAADLTKWLETRGLLPGDYPRTAKTRAPSGQADHLERLRHPLAESFLFLKKTDKVLNDYLVKVVDLADDDLRIHPETNILGASATGRMSVGTPPLQQFPGKPAAEGGGARGIILADEGDTMTSIDWSAIEPVIAANVAKDKPAVEFYEAGGDFYTGVAEKAGGITRKQAKVVLLAQMYGEGMPALSSKLGMTVEDGWDLRRSIFRTLPKVDAMLRRLKQLGRRHRLVFTLSGRIVPVPMGNYQGEISVQAHKAVNYFVQGSAYDVLAEAMVAIDEAGLGDGVYMAMHDELVVSTAIADDVQKIMQTPPERLCWLAGRVPVLRTDRADLGCRWAAE